MSAAVGLAGAALVAIPGRAIATPTPPPGAALVTPVLSMRRVPELIGLAVATSALDAGLDAALGNTQWEKSSTQACLVVQQGNTTLYQHNPALPLLPASNLKLLTATAALDKLPADDRLVTTVEGDRVPEDGTVAGNLYLVGGGDPLLYTAAYAASLPYPAEDYDNLAMLASLVKAAGVTTVSGSVVGDESRYDTQRVVPSWAPSYLTDDEVGPLSALSVNDGFATVTPATVTPATVTPAPRATAKPTPGSNPAPPAPMATAPRATVKPTPGSNPAPPATPHLVPAPQPAEEAAEAFTASLEAAGVTVAGSPQAGTAPAAAAAVKLVSLSSPPLPQLLGIVLRRSDNNGAELLTKELGRQVSGLGTTTAGVAAIEADLGTDGLPTTGLAMVDGSGLSRNDRATCQLIVAALDRAGPGGALGQGLPVAAKSGTLYQRFTGTPAAGRLRAKTGTLDGVSSLSGFVLPAGSSPSTGASGGQGVAFSLISNSVPTEGAGDALGNRVGVLLSQFPQMPPLSELGPQEAP